MDTTQNSLKEAVNQLASALESNQSKYNRALFDSQPSNTQVTIMQNCYDDDMPVTKISKITGVPASTVYSKIKTK